MEILAILLISIPLQLAVGFIILSMQIHRGHKNILMVMFDLSKIMMEDKHLQKKRRVSEKNKKSRGTSKK